MTIYTDVNRQNAILSSIYQSKLFSLFGLGNYSRSINQFVDGFITQSGVDLPNSSGAVFDNIVGAVTPSGSLTPGPNVSTSSAAISSPVSSGSATLTADGITNALGMISSETWTGVSGVSYVGQNFGSSPRHIRQMTLYQGYPGDPNYGVASALVQYSDNGSSWTTVGPAVPLTLTLSAQTFSVPASAPHQYWRLLANSGPGSSGRWAVMELQMSESTSSTSGMTLMMVPQATDAPVSSAQVLLDADLSVVAIVLNTDLTVDVSCDGGTTWASAALSLVTAFGQNGRSVLETADQPCISGSSFKARVKTYGKSITIYGLSVVVH